MASSAGPLYVCAKNASDNTVTLGEERTLYTKTVFAGEFNWIRPNPEGSAPMRVLAKTRYRQTGQWATVGKGRETLVEFDEPQKAVAPGQALVLYDGDDVVGGGTILRTSQRSHVLG
jgi:tRNA-specific 2-thiouridylase